MVSGVAMLLPYQLSGAAPVIVCNEINLDKLSFPYVVSCLEACGVLLHV